MSMRPRSLLSFREEERPQRRNLASALDFQLNLFEVQQKLPRYYSFKIVIETLWACVIFMALLLPMLVIAFFVYLFISKSVIYSQLRIGLNGRPFNVYKFRTMAVNTIRVVEMGYKPMEKIKNDPRVSGRLGHFLRNRKLDELPQLWNVIKGDMLLIGPRPYPYEENYEIPESQYIRYAIRPGISGPWQAEGDLSMSPEQKLILDRLYIEELSWKKDFLIFLKTIKLVIFMGEK